MVYANAYGWLVAQGLWRYVIGWAVGFLLGTVVVKGAGGQVRRAWREHMDTQRVIADRLDDATPSGIGALIPERQPPR